MLVDTLCQAAQVGGGDGHRDGLEICAENSRGALSTNTERAVRSDLAIYFAWCTERGVPALPARAETIAAFIDVGRCSPTSGRGLIEAFWFSFVAAVRAARVQGECFWSTFWSRSR